MVFPNVTKCLAGFYNWFLSKKKIWQILRPSRVDLHTPKMLIIQFHTSSVWENACHTIFIQFLKIVENWYKLCGCLILITQSDDEKLRFSFFEKNAYHTIPIYDTKKIFQVILKI